MSNTPEIKLHKEIFSDSSYVPSFTLKLTVTSTTGGITPCIFVHDYIPKNPMTGTIQYDFSNVAYADELLEVKDYVVDKKHKCMVRLSCIDKRFGSADDMEEFLSIVYKDIQRLLYQVSSTVNTGTCEDVTINTDSIAAAAVDCTPDTDSSDDNIGDGATDTETESIVLSFDGKRKN